MDIDFPAVIEKFDTILERGLCSGAGSPDGQMCIEAAISQAMGLPFGDDPECVAPAVRAYKIRLNDAYGWASPQSRAIALRSIGIAQIGSRGVVDDSEFMKRLAEKTIRVLIPRLFRQGMAKYPACLSAADKCEREGTAEAASDAGRAANAANAAAANAATYAAATDAANAANAAAAAAANAAYAAEGFKGREEWLVLSAELALEVLRELKSPGYEWINFGKEAQ